MCALCVWRNPQFSNNSGIRNIEKKKKSMKIFTLLEEKIAIQWDEEEKKKKINL